MLFDLLSAVLARTRRTYTAGARLWSGISTRALSSVRRRHRQRDQRPSLLVEQLRDESPACRRRCSTRSPPATDRSCGAVATRRASLGSRLQRTELERRSRKQKARRGQCQRLLGDGRHGDVLGPPIQHLVVCVVAREPQDRFAGLSAKRAVAGAVAVSRRGIDWAGPSGVRRCANARHRVASAALSPRRVVGSHVDRDSRSAIRRRALNPTQTSAVRPVFGSTRFVSASMHLGRNRRDDGRRSALRSVARSSHGARRRARRGA